MFNLFSQGSYIGYTATLIYNIFIDPDDYDQVVGGRFFKDFIFTLEATSLTIWVPKSFS